GTDILGNTINTTATTDANGAYQFDNLADGTYNVTQTQPSNFIDGQETVGNNATATAVDNAFNNLDLDAGVAATEFNFGEIAERLSKRRLLASST
ncbi:MAG: SdrD B-like domain-containing protein, partial [Planctomycetota bacterium]